MRSRLHGLLLCCLLLSLALPVTSKELALLPLLPEAIVCDDGVIAPLEPMVQLLGAKLTESNDRHRTCIVTRNGCRYEGAAYSVSSMDGKETFYGRTDVFGTRYVPLAQFILALGGTVQLDTARCVDTVKVNNPSMTLDLPLKRAYSEASSCRVGESGAVYLMNLDGSGLQRISFQTLQVWDYRKGQEFPYFPLPAISPDNAYIVYSPTPDTVFLRETGSLKGSYLHRSPLVPGAFKRMYFGFAFSPNGQRLLFFEETRDQQRHQDLTRLYLINTDGTGEQVVDHIETTPGRWSPDNQFILLGDNTIIDATTGAMRPCTEKERQCYAVTPAQPSKMHFPQGWHVLLFQICSDGKHVIFIANRR